MLPYRTADNVIDGVVMTFADITALMQTEAQVQEARDFAQNIIATLREPLVVLDGELRIVIGYPLPSCTRSDGAG